MNAVNRKTYPLGEERVQLAIVALQSAAAKWREWSASIANVDVADRFGRQADDAEALAVELAGADEVKLTVEVTLETA